MAAPPLFTVRSGTKFGLGPPGRRRRRARVVTERSTIVSRRRRGGGKLQAQTTNYIAIFSSSEGSKIARRLQDAFTEEGATARHWRDFVRPGRTIIDSVTAAAADASAVVIVATPDMETRRGATVAPTAVSNVLFELGVAIASVGLERTFIVRPAGVELTLPSDLGGVPWIPYEGSTPDELRRGLGACAREVLDVMDSRGDPGAGPMSWAEYFRLVDALAERTVLTKRAPHGVVAVNPGGAIVAGRLYFHNRGAFHLAGLFPRAQSRDLMLEIIRQLIPRARGKCDEGQKPRILVVDASIKSGESMHKALSAISHVLEGEEAEVETAVLVDVADLREPHYPVEPDIVISRALRRFPYGEV